MSAALPRRGPPPLTPFGLVLCHDGRWSHEGQPVVNAKLRERFDRSVRYLPEERKYVVQIGHFRGEIEIEEAGFFVRCFDEQSGLVSLSDGDEEPLDVSSLRVSAIDGALLCTVKRALVSGGLVARFCHGAHSAVLNAVAEDGEGLLVGGARQPLPKLALA
jgi:hypothetical protein